MKFTSSVVNLSLLFYYGPCICALHYSTVKTVKIKWMLFNLYAIRQSELTAVSYVYQHNSLCQLPSCSDIIGRLNIKVGVAASMGCFVFVHIL